MSGKQWTGQSRLAESVVTASSILPEQVEKRAITLEGSLEVACVRQLGIMHAPKFPQIPEAAPLTQNLILWRTLHSSTTRT